jgi:integrase
MTRLRKMMLEELERRNYSEATTRCYIRTVEDFSRRFKCSPDGLGPEHIREYQAELFKKRKLSPGTVTQRLAALRFFYIKTLKKTWSIAETPYPKRAFHLPSILSREEVARLINAALTPFHRTLLMTLYATGVRRAELTRRRIALRASDTTLRLPSTNPTTPEDQIALLLLDYSTASVLARGGLYVRSRAADGEILFTRSCASNRKRQSTARRIDASRRLSGWWL